MKGIAWSDIASVTFVNTPSFDFRLADGSWQNITTLPNANVQDASYQQSGQFIHYSVRLNDLAGAVLPSPTTAYGQEAEWISYLKMKLWVDADSVYVYDENNIELDLSSEVQAKRLGIGERILPMPSSKNRTVTVNKGRYFISKTNGKLTVYCAVPYWHGVIADHFNPLPKVYDQ